MIHEHEHAHTNTQYTLTHKQVHKCMHACMYVNTECLISTQTYALKNIHICQL